MLSEQRTATKENVQRKQARIEGERGDSDNEASASESDDEEDDDIPYNPKNLPLGWDGKVKYYSLCENICKVIFQTKLVMFC